MCPVRLFYPQLQILCFRPRSPCGKKLPELRHTGMPGCLMPPPEGIHFLRTPVETACVDSNPDKHRPHLAGNADRCIRGWNGDKYRPGRKCGDEIMSFSLIPLGNPDGLSRSFRKRRIVWRSPQSLPHLIPVLVTGILCVETVLIWERAEGRRNPGRWRPSAGSGPPPASNTLT